MVAGVGRSFVLNPTCLRLNSATCARFVDVGDVVWMTLIVGAEAIAVSQICFALAMSTPFSGKALKGLDPGIPGTRICEVRLPA